MLIRGQLLLDAGAKPTPGWLTIDDGRIAEVGTAKPPEKPVAGGPECLIAPGFIDGHLHFPQIDSVGYDRLELMEWLERVIYPAEMRWEDEDFAGSQIREAYRRLLRAGTLGYAAFLTSHFHGYAQCVRAGHDLPLRGFVGQAMMDRNAPEGLLNQELTRIARSERSRVTASVNPRFAVACSDDMLKTAKRKMRDDSIVHTHLAESLREIERVRELFPDDANATAVFDRHGLLGPRTLLAHAIHLSKSEWELIAGRASVVVHCPGANVFLQSGVFDLRAAREHGVRIALGSDIAAGPDIAMPRVARAMIETAKMRRMTLDPHAIVPSPAEAWRMITRGNAEALGWDDAGRIEAGAAADLLILRPPATFDGDEHLIGRLIYGWDEAWIDSVIVNGNLQTSKRQTHQTTQRT
jgi:guanine deaminase